MTKPDTAAAVGAAADLGSRPLWFAPPAGDEDRRRTPTHERVVAEALTVIAAHGVDALTMRALATRLGVVPAALYRHVRNKEQLHDLVLDGVLAEVDYRLDRSLGWTEQVKTSRSGCGPSSKTIPASPGCSRPVIPSTTFLALAEAFLALLHAADCPHRNRPGFSCSTTTSSASPQHPTSINEQRIRDAATRRKLHTFFRSLPADRFPTLIALGEHVWVDNRDERFTAGLDTVIDGLEAQHRRRRRSQHPDADHTAQRHHATDRALSVI